MNIVPAIPVPVQNLHLGDQVMYNWRIWIVVVVLPAEPGGWAVIAFAANDKAASPQHKTLIYANDVTNAQLFRPAPVREVVREPALTHKPDGRQLETAGAR